MCFQLGITCAVVDLTNTIYKTMMLAVLAPVRSSVRHHYVKIMVVKKNKVKIIITKSRFNLGD